MQNRLVLKKGLTNLKKKYKKLFRPIDKSQAGSTNVKAEIRITTSDPIYTKSYPYLVAMREEVEKQIKEFLCKGIICPSKSPYNSPVWIVPKNQNQVVRNNLDWSSIIRDLML